MDRLSQVDTVDLRHTPLPLERIISTWWPLAASWVLMAAELPVISAIVARLENPEIHLAAYGGVVFPLALIIEAPIIMLLAASTALCKDWDTYQKLRRFMMTSGAVLTSVHIVVAFTPLYYVVVGRIIGVPDVIIEPARIGLMIMTPWTWAIAYRRFNQGVLIRFGRSRAVGIGTAVRLVTDFVVLMIGYKVGNIAGIIVATSAVAAGVVLEAVYVGFVVQPVLKSRVKPASVTQEPLTMRSFIDFYVPLAMTSFMFLLAQPLGSAALSRMPKALESLAVWPVVSGLIFVFRSLGMAYNEVVVALLDEPNSLPGLRRFTYILASSTSLLLLIVAGTPLSMVWFSQISSLKLSLARMGQLGLWIALPLPALSFLQSWYQGAIVNGRKTRGITEAVTIYLVAMAVTFIVGVRRGDITGLYVGLAAMVIGMTVQTIWLWYRSKPVIDSINTRDAEVDQVESAET